MEGRELPRLAGLLAAQLPELDLDAVPDPRAGEKANGRVVVAAKKYYLFALKNEHRTMLKLATELLAPKTWRRRP